MPIGGFSQGFEAYSNIQSQDARAQLTHIQGQLAQTQLEQQQNMMKLLSRQGLPPSNPTGEQPPNSPDTLIGRMQTVADIAFRTGDIKEALSASRVAGQMQRDKATQAAAAARQKYQEFQESEKELQEVDGLLSGVHDPASFQAAKMTYMASHPGVRVPPQFAYYNPQMIEAIRVGTAQGLAKLRQEANDRAKTLSASDRADTISSRHFRDSLAAAREARQEAHEAREVKAGGPRAPVVGLPNAALMSYTQSLLNKDYPGEQKPTVSGFGKDQLFTQHAFDIASDAKAIMAQNRGLSASQAVARAYEAAKNRGDFAGYNSAQANEGYLGKAWDKLFGNKAPNKIVPGSVPTMPLPPPPDGNYVKGSYYTSNGKVGQYLGNGKVKLVEPEEAQ